MSDDIYYYRYQLESKAKLNARHQKKVVEGCLIRVGAGVACIQPWVELGDQSLESQLAAIKESRPYALGQQALKCAYLDGAARIKGVSLFDGITIPDSHLTVVSISTTEEIDLGGFSRIKIKGSADLELTKKTAEACLAQASQECCLRIDFNEVLDSSLLMNLPQVLGRNICKRIEFIEDPMRFDDADWHRLQRQTGLNFAIDRDCEKAVKEGSKLEWLIIKPAVNDLEALVSDRVSKGALSKWVVTSYMDHAIGQMYAAYQAAQLYSQHPESIRECGLLTHLLFDKDEFFEDIHHQGPSLQKPCGTGLGFDDQLEALPWKRL